MNPFFYSEEQGQRGRRPLPLHPQSPPNLPSLRIIVLDDSEHLFHNHHASVASLRLLFTFAPECRSPTERYLGCKQRFRDAVNDHIGLEPAAPS